MLLEGKNTLVTGAAQGIGKAISLTFAKEGAHVAVCDMNEVAGQETVNEIRALGRKSEFFKVDVSNAEEVKVVVDNALDKFSTIDILVNNAGITRDTLLVRMEEKDWDLVLNINLKGTFNFTKAVARSMMKNRTGKIINIASVIGLVGNAGQANYAASKAGVIAFTKSVARELASRGITANAVAPGFIQTAMTEKLPEDVRQAMLKKIPMGGFGLPQDVANVVLFLSSDLSRYVNGQVIQVCGGLVT
ncbi:MAG: 3-oxoacyl-[acyl-carrier-protein] reductase [Chlamydiae bacterium]|nr:3-oxoacyl-[acyl-carrier-protein] reductase [Chlamydiota bacterium]MBI3278141.1 3-oxoacyl-[acyl-carrier-protein] reductase [Chlamydiota bacterium]